MLFVLFFTGDLLVSLKRPQEAEKYYRVLIDRNPENKEYYLKLERALELTTVEQKLDLYKEYSAK